MNRFDKPRQYDYSFDRYMPEFTLPNFQLLAAALEGQEQKQAEFEELASKFPQYIQSGVIEDIDPVTAKKVIKAFGDTESAQLLKEKMGQLQSEMDAAFQTGNMAIINQTRNKVMREVQKIHGPTGWATGLQKRYDDHIKYLESLQKRADEDADWGSVNKKYAERQYLASIGKHDPTANTFTPLSAPSMYAYTNIEQQFQDFANKTGTQNVVIERKPDESGWMIKEGRQTATPEAIASLEAFLANPRLNEQYLIERYNILNASGGLERVTESMSTFNQSLDKRNEIMVEAKKLLEKADKSPEEIKKLNTAYQILGFAEPELVDGEQRLNTAEAERRLKNAPENYFTSKKIEDPAQYAQKLLEDRYRLAGKGALKSGYSYEISRDPLWLKWQEFDMDKQLIDYEQQYVNPASFHSWLAGDITADPEETIATLQQSQAELDELQKTFGSNLINYFYDNKKTAVQNMQDAANPNIGGLIANKAGDIIAAFKPGMSVDELRSKLIDLGIPRENVLSGNIELLHQNLSNSQFQERYQKLSNAQLQADNKRAEAEQVVLNNDGLFKDISTGMSLNFFDPKKTEYYSANTESSGVPGVGGTLFLYKNALKYSVNNKEYVISKGEADWLFSKPYNELTPYQKQHRDAITVTIAKNPEAQKVPAQKSIFTYFEKGATHDALVNLQNYLKGHRDPLSQIAEQKIYKDAGIDILDPRAIDIEVGGLGIGDNGLPTVKIKLKRNDGEKMEGSVVNIPLTSLTTPEHSANAIKQAFFQDGTTVYGEWKGTDTDQFNAGQIGFYFETGDAITLNNVANMRMKRKPVGTEEIIKDFSATKDGMEYHWRVFGKKDKTGKVSYGLRKLENGQYLDVDGFSGFSDIQTLQAKVGYLLTQPRWERTVRIKPAVEERGAKRIPGQ